MARFSPESAYGRQRGRLICASQFRLVKFVVPIEDSQFAAVLLNPLLGAIVVIRATEPIGLQSTHKTMILS
jgi:hypothetical protein